MEEEGKFPTNALKIIPDFVFFRMQKWEVGKQRGAMYDSYGEERTERNPGEQGRSSSWASLGGSVDACVVWTHAQNETRY